MALYPIERIPIVNPMMVRRFSFGALAYSCKGGLACVRDVHCEEVGLANERLDYDEAVVDCSYAILNLTTELMMANEVFQKQEPGLVVRVAYFNGRRWRDHRKALSLDWPEESLLYIGNPILITAGPDGIIVHRSEEFQIRSGCELMGAL